MGKYTAEFIAYTTKYLSISPASREVWLSVGERVYFRKIEKKSEIIIIMYFDI